VTGAIVSKESRLRAALVSTDHLEGAAAMRRSWFSVGAVAIACGGAALADEIVFKHVLTDAPLDVRPRPNEVETEAVKTFKQTGEDPYRGDEQALAEGKKLYAANCQACHLPDGSGRIGPSLIGDNWVHKRSATDVGMFEIIHGGASGAMQSYARRGMTQDQMLKIIAYVRSLKKA
jgi:cytochrome c-L